MGGVTSLKANGHFFGHAGRDSFVPFSRAANPSGITTVLTVDPFIRLQKVFERAFASAVATAAQPDSSMTWDRHMYWGTLPVRLSNSAVPERS